MPDSIKKRTEKRKTTPSGASALSSYVTTSRGNVMKRKNKIGVSQQMDDEKNTRSQQKARQQATKQAQKDNTEIQSPEKPKEPKRGKSPRKSLADRLFK